MNAIFTRKRVLLFLSFEQIASPAMQPQMRTPELTSLHSQPSVGTGSPRHPTSDGSQSRQMRRQVVRPTATAAGHIPNGHNGLSGDKKLALRLSEPSMSINDHNERPYESTVRTGSNRGDRAGNRRLQHGDGDRGQGGGDSKAAMHRLQWRDGEAALQQSCTRDTSHPQGLSSRLQQQDLRREDRPLGLGSFRHHGSIDHQSAARELLLASTSRSRGGDRKGWIFLAGVAVLAAAAAVVAAAAGRLRRTAARDAPADEGMAGLAAHNAAAEPVEIAVASFEPSLGMRASEQGAAQTRGAAAAAAAAGTVADPAAAGASEAAAATQSAGRQEGKQEGRQGAEPLEISIADFEPSVVGQADRWERKSALGREDGNVSSSPSSSSRSSSSRSSKSVKRTGHGGSGFFRFPVNALKHGALLFSGSPGHKEDKGEGNVESKGERGGERGRAEKKYRVQASNGNVGKVTAVGEGTTNEGAATDTGTPAEEEAPPLDVGALQVRVPLCHSPATRRDSCGLVCMV